MESMCVMSTEEQQHLSKWKKKEMLANRMARMAHIGLGEVSTMKTREG